MLISQEQGLDTVDANRALGLPDDCREYYSVRNILSDLGIKSIRLIVSPKYCYLTSNLYVVAFYYPLQGCFKS